MNKEKVYKDLNKLQNKVLKDEPMKNYTSFKVGGPADILVVPGHRDRLIATVKYLEDEKLPYIIMGNGSNLVFRDGGYRGVIVLTNSNADGADLSVGIDGNTVTASAGMLLSTLAKIAADEGLSGMEPISGVPGTVGGALFMNAGAYGGEIKGIIKSATVYDPKSDRTETIVKDDMDLSYRNSVFQNNGKIILDATFELLPGNKNDIKTAMRELTQKRNEKQPVNLPSAGSFFKRPEGFYAGKLVEDTGLKGLQKGGAQISELHSGFMVNAGGATAQDIEDLMNVVIAAVFDKFGIMLEPEVRIVGEF